MLQSGVHGVFPRSIRPRPLFIVRMVSRIAQSFAFTPNGNVMSQLNSLRDERLFGIYRSLQYINVDVYCAGRRHAKLAVAITSTQGLRNDSLTRETGSCDWRTWSISRFDEMYGGTPNFRLLMQRYTTFCKQSMCDKVTSRSFSRHERETNRCWDSSPLETTRCQGFVTTVIGNNYAAMRST